MTSTHRAARPSGKVNKVVLEDVGENKIQVIAAVKLLSCGLRAEIWSMRTFSNKENAPAEEAQIKEELEV